MRERRPNRGPTLSPLLSPSTSHSCIPTSLPPSEAKTISISDRLFLSLFAAESRPIRGRERQTAVRFDPRRSGEPHLGFPLALGVRGRTEREGAARVLFAGAAAARNVCSWVAGRARGYVTREWSKGDTLVPPLPLAQSHAPTLTIHSQPNPRPPPRLPPLPSRNASESEDGGRVAFPSLALQHRAFFIFLPPPNWC